MQFIASAIGRVALVAAFLVLQTAAPASATDFPMPASAVVTPPGPDVPPEWAAYSGNWEGRWGHEAPLRYVVTKIGADGSAEIIYSWADYGPWNWKAGHETKTGTFKDGLLVFKNRHGTYTQKMVSDSKMRSDFVGEGRSAGVNGTAIMKRK